jgi:hypothetical protein
LNEENKLLLEKVGVFILNISDSKNFMSKIFLYIDESKDYKNNAIHIG